jgi:putative transposase
MPYRKDNLASDNYYHVFNRGISSGDIFFKKDHYYYCLRLLKKYTARYSIRMIAYCLMPNHYHLLLLQQGEKPISQYIRTVFNVYVQALNRRINRRGPLFEGRFKHVLVDREEYLLHLCRYIHLNPVKAGIVRKPEDWLFSDYKEWAGLSTEPGRNGDFIQEHFGKTEEYRMFVEDLRQDRFGDDSMRGYLFD